MSRAYAKCPICERWVPADRMNYDDRYPLNRMCDWCLEGLETPATYFKDAVQCIFCDSEDVESVADRMYKCNTCGEIFYLI